MAARRQPRPLHPLLLSALAAAIPAHAEEGSISNLLSNPKISLILDGVAYADDIQGTGNERIGEAAGVVHGHHHEDGHGGIEEGFNLREAELVLSATVDNLFDGYANLAFGTEGAELEEAYFDTRSLPAGWQLRGGKFFSGFGYQNAKHPHSRDFVDQNLAYLSTLGDHGLNDTGVRLTWSPATDTYVQFGAEILQGQEQEKFGTGVDRDEFSAELLAELGIGTGDPDADGLPAIDRRGPQLYTGFVKVAPDLGTDRALQLGLSYALHKGHQEAHEEGDPVTDMFYTDGEAKLLGAEAVYKRSATGRYGQGAWSVQAEYLHLETDTEIVFHTTPAEIGETVAGTQDSFYVQGIYGFAPRWQAGLRYDAVGPTNELEEAGATTELEESSRLSAVLTFRPSEYSYLRLQASDADIADESGASERFAQVMLQYNLSLGAHGAHTF